MRRPHPSPGSIARGGAIALCIAAIVSGTFASSEAPRPAPASTALAGPVMPALPRDPVTEALAAARRAYTGGDLRAARTWIGIATQRLDEILARDGARERWELGNATQLLQYLGLYGLFAYGSSADLDRQYEQLSRDLARIDALNRGPLQPTRVGDEPVSYDLLSHLVWRIGDLRIGYDLITQQITSIGDRRVSYDLFTRQPTRIGDIEYDYDLFDRTVRSIAGVDTH